MKSARISGWLIATLVAGSLFTSLLPAQDDPGGVIGDGALQCRVGDTGVFLSWNIQFFAPIKGFEIYRNDALIATLPPDATAYADREVDTGIHRYDLVAVPLILIDPIDPIRPIDEADPAGVNIIDIVDPPSNVVGTCVVEYGRDPGLRCKAEENRVHLEWGPILIRIAFDRFLIRRNGVTIAMVPSDQLTYEDEVFSLGRHRYEVFIVAGCSNLPADELNLIPVGSCSVRVDCFGLRVRQSGLDVHLDWSHLPLIEIASREFTIIRDGERVGRTRDTRFQDTVPEPGTYVYEVYMDPGTGGAPVRIIGACRVVVTGPGERPLPVENLECAVAIPGIEPIPFDPALGVDAQDPDAVDTDGDGVVDALLPYAFVSLVWENSQDYDRIIVTRNKALVATLPGDATAFRDIPRVGGVILYSVYGVVGNARSEAAECRVELPPVIVPPPRDLTCVYTRIWIHPDDPDVERVEGNVIDIPFDAVILRWWNPARYARIAITRDGEQIALLEGSSTAYRDFNPPRGVHVYGVQGILADGRRSLVSRCRVEVGPEPVPPVEDLRCVLNVAESLPPQYNAALTWGLGGEYDAILIIRNGERADELPGDATRWFDRDLAPGLYTYSVLARRGDLLSERRTCQVKVDGPPERNLLYFSTTPIPVDVNADPDRVAGSSTLVSLADTTDALQGWSFGFSGDPADVQVETLTIDETLTGALHDGDGPDFLFLERAAHGGGAIMAAVISVDEPFVTIPAGERLPLLVTSFRPGPRARLGGTYPVRYTGTLNDPPVEVYFVIDDFEVAPATAPGYVFFRNPRFLRGDANGDGKVDMTDAMVILTYLFLGGEEPGCLEAANVNGSESVNIADAIFELTWEFLGGVTIPHPHPACDFAPAPLGCVDPGECPDVASTDS